MAKFTHERVVRQTLSKRADKLTQVIVNRFIPCSMYSDTAQGIRRLVLDEITSAAEYGHEKAQPKRQLGMAKNFGFKE